MYSSGLGALFFTSERDGNREIYRADSLGGNAVRLTNNNFYDGYPTISDSDSTLYIVSRQGDTRMIRQLDIDGKELARFDDFDGQVYYIATCRKGDRIVVAMEDGDASLYEYDPQTGQVDRLPIDQTSVPDPVDD